VNRQGLKRSLPAPRTARGKRRNLTEYLQLPPRWWTLLAGFVLIFGFMLFCGAIADSLGTLHSPGVGATVLLAVIVVVASWLVYLDYKVPKRRGK
jgi:prepilin signal peptidase PulO-like enzyme (type II secretory pathway)